MNIISLLAMLIIVMTIAGILKETGALASVYSILKPKVRSKRGLVALLSIIFGVLPVPGRICFACSILDSVQNKSKNNQKMGVIAHLSSHHYYLWSPMEKAIIIVCGVLGISFSEFISIMWLPALIMAAFSIMYIFNFVSEDEISLAEVSSVDTKGLWTVGGMALSIVVACIFPQYTWYIFGAYAAALVAYFKRFDPAWIDTKVLAFASGAVLLGNLFGSYQKPLMAFLAPYISGHAVGAVAVFAFLIAFAMGSSAKYAAFCGAIVKVIGIKYLPLMYLVEFAGYLMSPSHDCVAIAKSYFKTPSGMFFVPLVSICIILVMYGTLAVLF